MLVFPFPGLPGGMVKGAIDGALSDVQVDYRTSIDFHNADVLSVNGEALSGEYELEFAVWTSDKPDVYSGQPQLAAGRMLTLEDEGRAIAVLPLALADAAGIGVGDRVRLEGAPDLDLEVVGLTDSAADMMSFGDPSGVIPPGVLPASIRSDFTLYAFQVPESDLNRALTELSSVIIALAIDVQFIDGLIGRLIDQFAAIPTIVGILSLFSAAVIMANTVALATLERRRQIGILKAIGLKARRVLAVMFIESSIVGLLSAVIGIGVSALIINGLSAAGGIAIPLPTDARITAVALLIAAIVIGWVATFLSARVALKERVMNVLRYD